MRNGMNFVSRITFVLVTCITSAATPSVAQNDQIDSDQVAAYQDLGIAPNLQLAVAQRRLQQAGYYHGLVTGYADIDTVRAIARFQADHDLLASGILDQPTAQALGFNLSVPSMGPAMP